jgi:superfamily II DNA helicase RecQ
LIATDISPASTSQTCSDILREVFGYQRFRGPQQAIIENVVNSNAIPHK